MRVNPDKINFIKEKIREFAPIASIYLYGSRTDDSTTGGDIDFMLITENKVSPKSLRKVRREFYKRFGWQKLDIINFTKDDETIFKSIAMKDAILL